LPVIQLTTFVAAPVERVLDLARSIDLHTASTTQTGECAVAGVTSGLIELDQEVTWRARHFGVWQTLTARITGFDRPRHFRDSMLRGAFERFDHDHFFTESDDGTTMRDVFDYSSPLGPLGWVADRLFLTRYLRSFLAVRNRVLKTVAESGRWREFLRAD
jgi:ligand-binding SRPBCC domain-containing protein